MRTDGDYISREEAEKRLYQRAEIANSAYIDQTPHQIMMLAQNVVHLIPAADVRPNVTGKFYLQYNGDGCWHCSECNYQARYPSNFCPNCGADMREES